MTNIRVEMESANMSKQPAPYTTQTPEQETQPPTKESDQSSDTWKQESTLAERLTPGGMLMGLDWEQNPASVLVVSGRTGFIFSN